MSAAGPASDSEHDRAPERQVPAAPQAAPASTPGPVPAPLGANPDALATDWDNLPAHSTAHPVRHAAVARLQQREGNRRVQRRLKGSGVLMPVQRVGLWGMDKPPVMPQNFPDMTARVASLKNVEKVYLNLSTAYAQRGQEGMNRLIGEIDQELTKFAPNDKADCMAVVNGQKDRIELHRDRFLPGFETNARETVYTFLDTSRKSIRDEMQRYGFHEGMEVHDGEVKGTGKMEANPTAEMDELAKAAKHLAGEAEKLFNLGINLRKKYGEHHKGGPMEAEQNRQATEKDLLGDMSWVEANQKYELLYSDYMQQFPILAALKTEPNAVASLRAGGKSEVGNAMIWEKLKEKLDNIEETRANVAPGGSLNPLSLPNVVAGAKAMSNILPETLENRFVDDAAAKLKADKAARDKAVAVIGISLVIVTAVATAGGSLVVAAGATGAGLGLSAAEIINKVQAFQVESAAANTDLDKAKSISQNDPDLFWLAVDIVLFVLDVVQAGQLLRQAAGPVRKFAAARVSAERAAGGKLTMEEGERLGKMLADEVDPALAGMPEQARQRVRSKLDPSGKMPSVVTAVTRGAHWTEAEVRVLVAKSGQGKEALSNMAKHKVTLAPAPKNASWFDQKTNTVFISKNMSPDEAAATFVHEMTHADWYKTGKSANAARDWATKYSRFEYINKMCREEAAAEVAAIRHKFQSQWNTRRGIQASSPVEKAYSDAFGAESMRLRAANPGMDETMLEIRAAAVGEEAVYRAFVEGRIVNSITNESYVIYYGRGWDQVNLPLPRFPMPP